MPDTTGRLEAIIDECVQRLLRGESLASALRVHPEHAGVLEATLRAAEAMLRAPRAAPNPAKRAAALGRMLNQVQEAAEGVAARRGGIFVWLRSLPARPVAYQALAAAGACVLFGGLALGASAAAGTTPAPVRQLFGLASDSARVELRGTVTSVGSDAIGVDAGGKTRSITITSSTAISREGRTIGTDDLLVGSVVELKGIVQPDGSIVASWIHVETTPATATPIANSSTSATTPAGDDRTREAEPGDDRRGSDSNEHHRQGTLEEGDDRRTPASETTGTPEAEHCEDGGQEHAASATATGTPGTSHDGIGSSGGDDRATSACRAATRIERRAPVRGGQRQRRQSCGAAEKRRCQHRVTDHGGRPLYWVSKEAGPSTTSGARRTTPHSVCFVRSLRSATDFADGQMGG